jgi:HD-like signal output (HDOD) protein
MLQAGLAPFLTQAPSSLAQWIRQFDLMSMPVLRESAQQLEALREREDDADAHQLSDFIRTDPLFSLKVLGHVSQKFAGRIEQPPETVTAALVLLGIGPFFRTFGPQPILEEHFAHEPAAKEHVDALLERCWRASNFALGFAVHRRDFDAAVVQQAAILHDFAEILLWVRAPGLAMSMAQQQAIDPSLRSAVVQQQVLNIELADLQQALLKQWRLPELLQRITDDKHADTPQVRSVVLATQVARHSAKGWDNAAIEDDIAAIAQLLSLSPYAARKLLFELEA